MNKLTAYDLFADIHISSKDILKLINSVGFCPQRLKKNILHYLHTYKQLLEVIPSYFVYSRCQLSQNSYLLSSTIALSTSTKSCPDEICYLKQTVNTNPNDNIY